MPLISQFGCFRAKAWVGQGGAHGCTHRTVLCICKARHIILRARRGAWRAAEPNGYFDSFVVRLCAQAADPIKYLKLLLVQIRRVYEAGEAAYHTWVY